MWACLSACLLVGLCPCLPVHTLGTCFTIMYKGDNAALHWAAMRGHVEVVRALLAGGADREARNKQGAVPVELCQPVWSLSWRFTQAVLAAS